MADKAAAGDPQTTDEILQVFEHLVENEKTWAEFIAVHGLDPEKVARAFRVAFDTGGGQQAVATKAFVLGLQFGAMRLDAFEGYEEKPCGCLFCSLRRAAEAEVRKSEGGG